MVCVDICTYICVRAYVCIHTCARTREYAGAPVVKHIFTPPHPFMYIYMYVYVCIYICIFMYVYVCMYMCMSFYVYSFSLHFPLLIVSCLFLLHFPLLIVSCLSHLFSSFFLLSFCLRVNSNVLPMTCIINTLNFISTFLFIKSVHFLKRFFLRI